MLRRVASKKIDVSEECITSIIMLTRIGELRTNLAVTSNRSTPRRTRQLLVTDNVPTSPMMMMAIYSFETPFLTRATLCNIPDDGILQVQI
jgi:hypothetical protein